METGSAPFRHGVKRANKQEENKLPFGFLIDACCFNPMPGLYN